MEARKRRMLSSASVAWGFAVNVLCKMHIKMACQRSNVLYVVGLKVIVTGVNELTLSRCRLAATMKSQHLTGRYFINLDGSKTLTIIESIW